MKSEDAWDCIKQIEYALDKNTAELKRVADALEMIMEYLEEHIKMKRGW